MSLCQWEENPLLFHLFNRKQLVEVTSTPNVLLKKRFQDTWGHVLYRIRMSHLLGYLFIFYFRETSFFFINIFTIYRDWYNNEWFVKSYTTVILENYTQNQNKWQQHTWVEEYNETNELFVMCTKCALDNIILLAILSLFSIAW